MRRVKNRLRLTTMQELFSYSTLLYTKRNLINTNDGILEKFSLNNKDREKMYFVYIFEFNIFLCPSVYYFFNIKY